MTVVAVADGVDAAEAVLVGAPPLAIAGLHGQGLVHEDPATAARALLAEGLLRHEVVGGLPTLLLLVILAYVATCLCMCIYIYIYLHITHNNSEIDNSNNSNTSNNSDTSNARP